MNRRTVLKRVGTTAAILAGVSQTASASYHDCYWPHQDPSCYVDVGEPCPPWCCACI